jgi:hypothetical protein
MELARKVLVGLAWLYVLGVALQFLFAGIGLPQLGNEGMDLHEAFGYSALHFTPVLFIPLALVAKAPRNLLILIVVFTLVSIVQPIWVSEFQGELIASLHIVGALVIFVLAHSIARQATQLLRSSRVEAAPRDASAE